MFSPELTTALTDPTYINTGEQITLTCELSVKKETEIKSTKWYLGSDELTTTSAITTTFAAETQKTVYTVSVKFYSDSIKICSNERSCKQCKLHTRSPNIVQDILLNKPCSWTQICKMLNNELTLMNVPAGCKCSQDGWRRLQMWIRV